MHLIWDWNGTLLCDLAIVLEAVNAAIVPLGAAHLTEAGYQEHYTRPVSMFYERLLGRPLTASEWGQIDADFHLRYTQLLDDAHLADGAEHMLARVAANGQSQSLLSMAPHDHLVPLVHARGIGEFFVRIDGSRNERGAGKTASLHAHLEVLGTDHGVSEVIMVGDAIDDAMAAREVGIDCVLYANGSHRDSQLAATGFPVVHRLRDAQVLAGNSGRLQFR